MRRWRRRWRRRRLARRGAAKEIRWFPGTTCTFPIPSLARVRETRRKKWRQRKR